MDRWMYRVNKREENELKDLADAEKDQEMQRIESKTEIKITNGN